MARLPRLTMPGIPQHVLQRGNNKQVCFFDETDYRVYLDKLKLYGKKYQVDIHAYVLMTNHVHLLLTSHTVDGTSRLMQSLGCYYVRYINQTYARTGTLWEGRFKSTLVDSEKYFLTVSRYIELNPVRAGMVSYPAEYPWSSYCANGLGKRVQLLTPHYCYQSLGKNKKLREAAYQELFKQEIPAYLIQEIRDAINKAWVLGKDRFRQQIEEQTGRRTSPILRGGDRRSARFKSENKAQ